MSVPSTRSMPSVREAPPTASATPSLLSEQPALPVGSPGLRRVRICERQTAQVKLHLEEAYTELLKDIQWKVRRTLSYSLHEIALILGPKLTQDSLLPALDTFLKDLDEVKVGVVQNLAKLLGAIEPAARQQYVPLLVI